MRIITCTVEGCKNEISGNDSFRVLASKNGWKCKRRGAVDYYVCPGCASKLGDSYFNVDNSETTKLTESLMGNLKKKVEKSDKEDD